MATKTIDVVTIEHLAQQATHIVPTGISALNTQLAQHDGYPKASSYVDHENINATPSVDDEAHARQGDLYHAPGTKYKPGPARRLERIEHLARQVVQHLHEMLTIAEQAVPKENLEHLRCIGTGDAAGAHCHQWGFHKDGRCIDCTTIIEARQRQDRAAKHAARMRAGRHCNNHKAKT